MPASPSPAVHTQGDRDRDHLRILAIFHFIVAGLALVGAVVVVFEIVLISILPGLLESLPENAAETLSGPEGELIGTAFTFGLWFFVAILVFVVAEFILNLIAGFDLLKRRHRTLCLAIAGLNCLSVPLGTALGVCTFIVLSRSSVRDLYARQ